MATNIFDYLNYRDFLKAYYLAEKEKNPYFSFQKMAWKAGFRSKSFFNEVIAGKKNISSNSIFSVARALGLEDDAFAYFEALVSFNQAKQLPEKERWFRHLAQFHRHGKSQLVTKDQYEFYSKWYHNTIRELITIFDFNENYTLLAKQVSPAIGAAQVKASVKLLLRLGLVIKMGNLYQQANTSITTGNEVKALAIASFHKQNMQLASDSIENCAADKRDISCLIAGLSSTGFTAIKAEIQSFRQKLVEIIRNDGPAHEVYHINFQIFQTTTIKNQNYL